jgi:hypothetical protein
MVILALIKEFNELISERLTSVGGIKKQLFLLEKRSHIYSSSLELVIIYVAD